MLWASLMQWSACRSLNINTGLQQETFQCRDCFVKLGHFDKHFIKKNQDTLKLDTLKTIF